MLAAGTWEEMARVVQACEAGTPRRRAGLDFRSPMGRDGKVGMCIKPSSQQQHVTEE